MKFFEKNEGYKIKIYLIGGMQYTGMILYADTDFIKLRIGKKESESVYIPYHAMSTWMLL